MRPTKGASGYLLDTNVILHSALAPKKLGPTTTRILTEKPNVFFSPISITEIEVKALKGKLPVPANLHEDLIAQQFEEKTYRSVHANEIKAFPSLLNHDPYDRMLLAQASVENLTLITSDEFLLSLGLPWITSSTA